MSDKIKLKILHENIQEAKSYKITLKNFDFGITPIKWSQEMLYLDQLCQNNENQKMKNTSSSSSSFEIEKIRRNLNASNHVW